MKTTNPAPFTPFTPFTREISAVQAPKPTSPYPTGPDPLQSGPVDPNIQPPMPSSNPTLSSPPPLNLPETVNAGDVWTEKHGGQQ